MIDYRIYAPDGDGHTKLDHVADMLKDVVLKKNYRSQSQTWIVGTQLKS